MKRINTKFLFILLFIFLPVKSAWAQLDSLDLMIGQMIMVGFNGTKAADDTLVLSDIKNGYVGGVLLFEKNITATNSWINLKKLTASLQALSETGLWIAIDQEGGRVNRLKPKYGFPPSVTAEYLGKINNRDSTKFYAELTAATLSALGINLNFAPVVDLASNPNNPAIAGVGRAYAADPSIVSKHAEVVVNTHKKYKISTSLKHFPGHGSSTTDSHLGMADVTNTWKSEELLPYKYLIDSGMVDAIMSAHIVNRQLDSASVPSTLSYPVITGILRDSLNFDGVVFSDDMHMHAIGKYYGTEDAVLQAINAGIDVLVFSNNISGTRISTSREIHGFIKRMVLEGKISELRIAESYRRITQLKSKND